MKIKCYLYCQHRWQECVVGVKQVSLYRNVPMIKSTVLSVTLATLSAMAGATPIPDFDIKAVLASPQDRQAAMYESLTKQWEEATDEEKESFRLSMRKQLDTLSPGEKLAVVGQIFAAVGRAKTGAMPSRN
jgi:hypothetical protein